MTKDVVPIHEVARNLIATERLIHESLQLLPDMYDGLELKTSSVSVSELTNASPLREIVAVAVFLAYQEELEKEVPELIERLTGVTVPGSYDTLVTALVLMVAVYVIDYATRSLFARTQETKLREEYMRRLEYLEDLTNVPAADLNRLVEKRFSAGKVRSLLRKSIDFFRPATNEKDAIVDAGRVGQIERDALNEIPTALELTLEETRTTYEEYAVSVELHRADVDYAKQGWVAVIPDISVERKKMTLPPEIPPSELYGVTTLVGDVTVVQEKKLGSDFTVKEYHLIRVIEIVSKSSDKDQGLE
ncbi:MAG: hypothetical protein AAF265_05665 [Pseudomonadota bacterium]